MKAPEPAVRPAGTSRFRLGHGFEPVSLGLLGVIAAILIAPLLEGRTTLFTVWPLASIAALVLYFLRTMGSVEVGDDGIVVRRILRRIVVPIESVRDVET